MSQCKLIGGTLGTIEEKNGTPPVLNFYTSTLNLQSSHPGRQKKLENVNLM